MPGGNEQAWVTTCAQGINQNPEEASSQECADARNVYAPFGRVEQRPGYVGIAPVFAASLRDSVAVEHYFGEDVSEASPWISAAAGSLILDNAAAPDVHLALAAGVAADRWYIGSEGIDGPVGWTLAYLETTASNTSAGTYVLAEYWNGAEWAPVVIHELDYTGAVALTTSSHLSHVGNLLMLVPPQDWAATTVNGQEAFWIRLSLRGTNLDGSVTLNTTNSVLYTQETVNDVVLRGIFVLQFPTRKIYSTVFYGLYALGGSGAGTSFQVTPTIITADGNRLGVAGTTLYDPATIAVVPDFNEAFVAYGYRVQRITDAPTIAAATVEDRDFAVGLDAPYDRTQVVLESAWPAAKYITFFNERLWAAGIEGEPYTIRWTARTPHHKVWPSLQYSVLMEDDNSPITGMMPLGEHLIVFKTDSIWAMVDQGTDAFGLHQFVPRRVVAGIGCVAQTSIQQVRGRLVFLSEDGIYSFDGVAAKKISRRIQKTIDTITPARRPLCSSVNWKSQELYMLSITTDGSAENNTTIVWDYSSPENENGPMGWWIWDNIDAQVWMIDEGAADMEQLYFGDRLGNIYRFGVGATDHGGTISSYIVTQPYALNDPGARRVLREIEAMSSNQSRAVSVAVLDDDLAHADATSYTLDLTDVSEADWTDFSWASGASTDDNWVAPRRRLRRLMFREPFQWVQAKLSHNTKYQPWELSQIVFKFIRQGNR